MSLLQNQRALGYCVCSTFTRRPLISANRPPVTTRIRHATHGAQGRANGPKNGPGKRLGAKKTGDEYVIPGNILYRQRGTLWHAGSNVDIGRDHTLYALQPGFVKYYRDPRVHPKRRYIGVVFDKRDTLPAHPTAPRRRRLGFVSVPRKDLDLDNLPSDEGLEGALMDSERGRNDKMVKLIPAKRIGGESSMRPDYSYRESNWEIGRSAEKAGINVRVFERGDRFRAWRKRSIRVARAVERKAMGKKKGSTKKGKKRRG